MKKKKSITPAVSREKVVELYRQAVADGIPTEVVEEKITTFLVRSHAADSVAALQDFQQAQTEKQHVSPVKKIFFTFTPLICILVGLFLVGSAVWPIVSYYVFTAPELSQNSLLAPVPRSEVMDIMPKIIVQAQTQSGLAPSPDTATETEKTGPTIVNTDLDYTNLSNWFPSLALPQVDDSQGKEFMLDIPAIDISNAVVKLGGSNLDKSLIQYPGTALPGQSGIPVIFGHSVLRQFYNPSEKNSRRYISIFSKIMTLKKGDKIFITMDNIKYTYIVNDRIVVKPDDTSILEQNFDEHGLRLVTCVPEGTIDARGAIQAVLADTQ